MSASTVAIVVASQASIQASNAALAARRAECAVIVDRYDAGSASIEQMQAYAICVETLHPKPMSPSDVVTAKVFFVIALLGMAFGIYKAGKDRYSSAVDYVALGLAGFFLVPLGAAFSYLVLIGIAWLFTS